MEAILHVRGARWAMRVLLLVLVAAPGAVRADIVATGDLTITTLLPSSYTGTVRFDAVGYTPFGVPTAFLDTVGQSSLAGAFAVVGPGGVFDQLFQSDDAGNLAGSAAGAFLCAPGPNPACQNGVSFVGTFSGLAGSALAGLPADAVYTFDGTLAGPPLIDGSTWWSPIGRLTINAFRPVSTPPSPPGCVATNSCSVPVDQSVSYALPDGTTGSTTVHITYPRVTAAGGTTVSALSNAEGTLPADVVIDIGGYRAAFFELQTTAAIDVSGGSIEVCIGYDLGSTGVLPSQLRFLHREDGVFVDRTSRVDEGAGVVCGALTSFSPVVLGVTIECSTNLDCNDANPCTDDLCTALGACLHAIPTGCSAATKASLKIKDSADPGKDKLAFKFAGPGINFGAPTATTSYAVCLLDGTPGSRFAADVPAAGLCNTKPCWKTKNTTHKYKNKLGSPDGITAMTLKGDANGNAKITAKGKGAAMSAPSIPLTVPVTAFVRRLDAAACWSATFAAPSKNLNGTFSAKQ